MTTIAEALKGQFVVTNLGAGGDRDYAFPVSIRSAITLIEVDAADEPKSGTGYHSKHLIKTAIADTKSRHRFREHKYLGCSSLLPPREDLVKIYGLEKHFEVISAEEIECDTLTSVVAKLGIGAIDFLKIDLEGMDFPVIQSMGALLDRLLCLKCELFFQPLHVGAAHFHQAAAFLYDRGFELLWMRPEYWKPKTRHSGDYRDGRLVWADCIFLRQSEGLGALDLAKEIIIASALGKRCYGEYLFERYRDAFSGDWIGELEAFVAPAQKTIKDTLVWRTLRAMKYKLLALGSKPSQFYAHLAES